MHTSNLFRLLHICDYSGNIIQISYDVPRGVSLGKKITEVQEERNRLTNEMIKTFVNAEMKRNNVTHKDVAQRLTEMGRPISVQSLKNAISRGNHKTVWFMDLMQAITGSELVFRDTTTTSNRNHNE